MNNRKNRMYIDGTAALKIDRAHSCAADNIVRLGRAQDGSLVANRRDASTPRVLRDSSCAGRSARQGQNFSLRDDLRVAFDAMGFKGMERNLFEGSVASRTYANVGVLPVAAASAIAFVFTTLMMLA